jgi:hypothetical protein
VNQLVIITADLVAVGTGTAGEAASGGMGGGGHGSR